MDNIIILFGKTLSKISTSLNVGGGSTWPGHIALKLNKNFISDALNKSKIKTILIAGTNGKTTTGKLIKSILEKNGNSVITNQSGANLLNGIASSIVAGSSNNGKLNEDYAIFEVDENTLPLALEHITPNYLVALNLFRDQLDRYGEVNTISKKWKNAFSKLTPSTMLVLNADDPLISSLGKNVKAKKSYFGINDKKYAVSDKQNAADSTYCPFCGSKLSYDILYFSHLGNWHCPNCNEKRPSLDIKDTYPSSLEGTYNIYNTLAATLLADKIGVASKNVKDALSGFKPAFGRQEKLTVNNKVIQIFLSKNPTSFNESLRAIKQAGGKDILIALNDRIPDGRDISWIWDTDIENLLTGVEKTVVSGDRAYDMALRIKYGIGDKNLTCEPNLSAAIEISIKNATSNLYILPTYSAMLDVRKYLTGKKIL